MKRIDDEITQDDSFVDSVVKPEKPSNAPVLKKIFDRYAKETITDEQIRRIMAPVLRMIQEGKFDRSFLQRYKWLIHPLISGIAIAALILTVAFSQTNETPYNNINIPTAGELVQMIEYENGSS